MKVPPLPLPQETVVTLLSEDKQVRRLTELLIAVVCIPAGMVLIFLVRGGSYDPDATTLLSTAIGLAPLILIASLRRPSTYVLTSHRIAEVADGRFVWQLRFEQITRIRRIGATLHLRGKGRTTYSVQNLRHVYWLEHYLWDRTGA